MGAPLCKSVLGDLEVLAQRPILFGICACLPIPLGCGPPVSYLPPLALWFCGKACFIAGNGDIESCDARLRDTVLKDCCDGVVPLGMYDDDDFSPRKTPPKRRLRGVVGAVVWGLRAASSRENLSATVEKQSRHFPFRWLVRYVVVHREGSNGRDAPPRLIVWYRSEADAPEDAITTRPERGSTDHRILLGARAGHSAHILVLSVQEARAAGEDACEVTLRFQSDEVAAEWLRKLRGDLRLTKELLIHHTESSKELL